MKKIYLSIISFAMILFFGTSINAQSVEQTTATKSFDTDLSAKAPEMKKAKAAVNAKSGNLLNIGHSSLTITRESGIYRIGGTRVNINSNSVTSGNNIVLRVTQNSVTVESYYKKVANNRYSHYRNVYIDATGRNKILNEYNFWFAGANASNCRTAGNDLKSGNCIKGYYDVSRLVTKTYVGVSNTVSSQNIISYPFNSYYLTDYSLNDFYKRANNRLIRYKRIEAPRKKNTSYLSRVSEIYYHNNGRISGNITYGNLGYSRSVAKVVYKNKTTSRYNGAGKMTSKKIVYNMQRYVKGKFKKYYATTHNESRSYYRNNRVKQVNLHRRNTANTLTQSRKTVYRSNGKKYTYKLRSYKRSKVSKQTFYKYNAKGNNKARGAYRIVVNYNKKGKATKAVKAKYNKKGKLGKAKKQKLTKSVTKF